MAKKTLQIADKKTLDSVDATTKSTEEKIDSLKESCGKIADKATLDAVKSVVDTLGMAIKSVNTKVDELKECPVGGGKEHTKRIWQYI